MATKKKLLQAAAGNAAGGAGGLDIPDVFSTYLYSGNDASKTITNGIDLDGEGGLVWIKQRDGSTQRHVLSDTERGTSKTLSSDRADAEFTDTTRVTSFNSDGFDLGSSSQVNGDPSNYASWTFRKAPKFFDVVEYTGNNTARTISHNLGTTPGLIICKAKSSSGNWKVWHRSLSNGASGVINLNLTGAETSNTTVWNNTLPTDTVFSLGTSNQTNETGLDFVAYLFAHNDGDGEFGPDSDQDIIKCGSYTGNGSDGNFVNLGFEPQWVMVKNTTAGSGDQWWMFDSMRGIAAQPTMSTVLFANLTSAELSGGSVGDNLIETLATGFNANSPSSAVNGSGNTYIYMAIRRGQLAVPEDAAEVFDIYQNESTATVPAFKHPFPVDFAFYKAASNTEDWWYSARLLQGQNYRLNVPTYSGGSGNYAFDYMDGWLTSSTTQTDYYSWAWKRAPNFFDVVTYSGTNSVQNVPHNLGVAPKLMIIRMLGQNSPPAVYWEPAGNTENYFLTATGNTDNSQFWNSTTPTDSVFTVKGPLGDVNYPGYNYHAMLFGELDGISKIGSYVGNGSTQNIDCGFASGARLVLIKGSTSGDWILFDAKRGIVAGDDPYLRLNSGSAQITNKDYIDAYSSGFTVNTDVSTIVNANGTTYYFYAIA